MPADQHPLGPKADRLDQTDNGQAFSHQLDASRDWEMALDLLHHLMVQQSFYIAIAANTRGGVFNPPMKKGITIKRIKKDLPEELQLVLKLRKDTFKELSTRIKEQSLRGNNKDVWHFKSQWKELPKGTAVISLYQRPLWNLLSTEPIYRQGYIILDGQASVDTQNKAMFLISKVLRNKEFADREAKQIGSTPIKEAKVKKRIKTIYTGRPTGELVLLLKETFGIHVRTLSIEERVALGYYFLKLKLTGELDDSHVELHTKLKRHFKTEDLQKIH